jgi:hypothetical protein
MKRKIAFALICLLPFNIVGLTALAQEKPQPLSRQELVALLKQAGTRSLTQSDIVAEVERRGIAFAIDEKVLNELRQEGARSFLLDVIKRSGDKGGQPLLTSVEASEASQPADAVDEEAMLKARAEALAKMPLIEQARQHALDYTKELPNFIVTQKVTRYLQTPGSKGWQLEDTLEGELTYSTGKGEQYKLLRINGKPTQQSYEALGGSTSTGEFGSTLASLFIAQSKAEFTEAKKEIVNGRTTVIYDFVVKKANSNNMITDKKSGQKTIAGYRGSIWIDTETKQALRIETSNEGMPANFPITLSENAVDYDWITIDGERYLLPVRAELILGVDRERIYTRNVIEFRNYQKFGAKIKIE